jgi:hypothetical protein
MLLKSIQSVAFEECQEVRKILVLYHGVMGLLLEAFLPASKSSCQLDYTISSPLHYATGAAV